MDVGSLSIYLSTLEGSDCFRTFATCECEQLFRGRRLNFIPLIDGQKGIGNERCTAQTVSSADTHQLTFERCTYCKYRGTGYCFGHAKVFALGSASFQKRWEEWKDQYDRSEIHGWIGSPLEEGNRMALSEVQRLKKALTTLVVCIEIFCFVFQAQIPLLNSVCRALEGVVLMCHAVEDSVREWMTEVKGLEWTRYDGSREVVLLPLDPDDQHLLNVHELAFVKTCEPEVLCEEQSSDGYSSSGSSDSSVSRARRRRNNKKGRKARR